MLPPHFVKQFPVLPYHPTFELTLDSQYYGCSRHRLLFAFRPAAQRPILPFIAFEIYLISQILTQSVLFGKRRREK